MLRLIIAAVIFIPSAVFCAEERFGKCHQMSTDYIRLMCYDSETGYAGVANKLAETEQVTTSEEEPPEEPSGKQWAYSEENSALDNRKDVWLSVISENKEANSIGSPIRATLWVRCMENRTNVLIGFDRYTTDNQSVRYKLDDGPVKKQWMETMRGGGGIGIWSGGRAIPFTRQMFDKERLVIAYDTYTGPVEFTFDISGLRDRIEPLASACEWSP